LCVSKQIYIHSFPCIYRHKTRPLNLSCLKLFGAALLLFTYKHIPSVQLSEEPPRKKLTTSYKPKYVHHFIDITETK